MKILTNKKYYQLNSENRILENEKEELKSNYKNMVDFYDELLNELYSDLIELNHNIKTNTSKEKLRVKVQDMIIKIGGRR